MLHKKRKPSTFTLSSGFADCKRNAASNNNMLHSKSTYFYGWSSLAPSVCSLALLLGLGIVLNPATNISSIDKAYAETITANPTDYSSISLTISNNGTELNSGDTVSTNVEPGLISYISNNLKIDTKKINRFYVSVQAAEDGSSELTGTVNKATIAPVGSNKIPTATDENGFGDNTWGFALGDSTTVNESMSYNSLPAYGASTTPQYSSATNLADGTYNLKLTFAAKINADKPSDHYTTKAMVSVAADAKEIPKFTWETITRMQDMTSETCANATSGASKQLIDDRTASGLGQTKYWVTKLNDGKCWMTQNLDLSLVQGSVLKPDDTDVATNYTIPSLTDTNYIDPGNFLYKPSKASSSMPADIWSSCGDNILDNNCLAFFDTISSTTSPENMHYAIGNYYTFPLATAGTEAENSGSLCPKNWELPAKSVYDTLGSTLNSDTIRTSPYYFIPMGTYYGKYLNLTARGHYWSSTPPQYSLGFYANISTIGTNTSSKKDNGMPIRCIAK